MKFTLAFDVYGTLIDTAGVLHALERMLGEKARPFMEAWRSKQLEYTFRRGLMDKYVDFAVCTEEALEYCCKLFGAALTNRQKQSLMEEYTVLPAFPDAVASLKSLQADGHSLFAFSNGSKKAVTSLLGSANLIDYFEGVVSVEDAGVFKPSPLVYAHFNQVTGSEKSGSWLISGNSFDVVGAVAYGMQAAWVRRAPQQVFDPWGIEPTTIIHDLNELPGKLKASGPGTKSRNQKH